MRSICGQGAGTTTMRILKKHLFFFFLFATLVFSFASRCTAQLPEVSTPLESKLYQGSVEDIKAFISQRQSQIKKIINEIDQIFGKNVTKDLQSSATAIKDLFQGVSLQYKSLLAELSRTLSAAVSKPIVAGPPYNIEDFDKILSYQRQINNQLTDSSKQFTLLQRRLASLKKDAIARLSEYVRLSKTEVGNNLLLYEKYGDLLNLQVEYARLQIKKPKLEQRLTELNGHKKIAAAWIKEAFTKIKVSQKDINKAQQLKDDCLALLNKTTVATSAEYQDLNRRLLIYEARLNESIARLKTGNGNDLVRLGWQTEKERIELIIDALKLRVSLINQKRLNCEIKILKNNFRLQWLSNYQDDAGQNRLADFIKEWSPEADKLAQQLKTITTSISEAILARSSLTQKLVTIHNKEAAAKTAKTRKELATLARQAAKANENIDRLILALSDNEQDIRNVKEEIEKIIDLTHFALSSGERFRTWSALHLADLKERIQSIRYYPLFSIGTSTVTLQIILNIIVLFFIGIFLLRLLRRKIVHLLEKKAGMSIGAINSITTLGYYASLFVGTMVILSAAGLDLSQLSIILGALGVGIGFGLQTITNNFFSGIILLTEQTVKVGDYVHLEEGLVGEVKKMSIRATIVRSVDGEDIIVPNSEFVSNRVNTWTYGDDWRRLNIPFGVSYDSDPDEVVCLAEAAAREVNITKEDSRHRLRIFFEGFGDNSLDFSIRAWCRMSHLKAPSGLKSDYYFALFRKLKEAGITIPFPQRDLHLQSASPEVKKKLKALVAPEAEEEVEENC